MVIPMETVNTPDFLYAKQLLCILSLTRLKRAVKIKGVDFSAGDAEGELKVVLENLKDNLTFPLNAMRKGNSHIDFDIISESVDQLLKVNVCPTINDIVRGQVTEAQIYHKPNKTALYGILKKEFVERNKLFDCRYPITRILKELDNIFNMVNAYARYPDAKINVSMAIAAINMIESVDFAFSLAEEGERVFDCDKDLIIEVIEND